MNSVPERASRLGWGTVLHIAPSNIPVNFAFSFLMGFLSGNSNYVRVPSTPYPQVDLIVNAIDDILADPAFETLRPQINFFTCERDHPALVGMVGGAAGLVVWGGEFGRTAYCQGQLTRDNYGRDHHPRCFTTWLAGGGIKPGISYGKSDEYGYNIANEDGDPLTPTKETWTPGTMHIHDLNATILHLLGIDHRRLTYRYQGRDFRLTDVHGHVMHDLLA